MAGKKFDIVAKVGTYTKDGQEKAIWRTVGAVVETDKGPFIEIERSFNPAALADKGDGKAYLSLFEPEAKEARPAKAPTTAPKAGDFDDDIPF